MIPFFRIISDTKEYMNLKIKAVMTPCPYKISSDASVEDAINTMELRGIRHLPIEKDGEVTGIVSLSSAKVSKAICDSLNYCPNVGEIAQTDPLIFGEEESLAKAAKKMAETKEDCALVGNNDGEVTGIFTVTDCLKALSMVLEG